MSLKVCILPTLKMILVEAVLNTVVYQMLRGPAPKKRPMISG